MAVDIEFAVARKCSERSGEQAIEEEGRWIIGGFLLWNGLILSRDCHVTVALPVLAPKHFP